MHLATHAHDNTCMEHVVCDGLRYAHDYIWSTLRSSSSSSRGHSHNTNSANAYRHDDDDDDDDDGGGDDEGVDETTPTTAEDMARRMVKLPASESTYMEHAPSHHRQRHITTPRTITWFNIRDYGLHGLPMEGTPFDNSITLLQQHSPGPVSKEESRFNQHTIHLGTIVGDDIVQTH